jgi:hypothetical protein
VALRTTGTAADMWLSAEFSAALPVIRKVGRSLHPNHITANRPCRDVLLLNLLIGLCAYRAEFEKNIAVDKRDFAAIEFLLRKGRRQVEVYSSPGIKDIR